MSDIIDPLSLAAGEAASAAVPGAAQFRRGRVHARPRGAGPVVSRRAVLKSAGGAAVLVAGGAALVRVGANGGTHFKPLASTGNLIQYTIGATDGWVAMPREVGAMPPFFPDPWGPPSGDPSQANYTTFVFGFRDLSDDVLKAIPQGFLDANHLSVTDGTDIYTALGKGKAQYGAPILHCQVGDDLRLTLKNLSYGWETSNPDLHTIHFHGFPNQIAYFDGVPDASLAAPPNRQLDYRYIPEDPGTYMWHCHIDDVEHVNMGLTGLVYVSPRDPAGSTPGTGLSMAYDDPSTKFDRQFPILVNDLFQQGHFNNRHIQDTDWTEYNGTFRVLNGRAWPDTIAPSVDPITGFEIDPATGALTSKLNTRLRYQPNSSLIQGISGETILIRLSNLGFEEHSLVLPGLPFRMIGRDAKYLGTGRPDYDVYVDYAADPNAKTPAGSRGDAQTMGYGVDIGPGESRDLLITLPTVPAGGPTKFPFYDRQYGGANPSAIVTGANTPGEYGGMRTEVWVYPDSSTAGAPAKQDPIKNRTNTIFPTA